MPSIDDILELQALQERETQLHLEKKASFTSKIKDLENKRGELLDSIRSLKDKLKSPQEPSVDGMEILELKKTSEKLEEEISTNRETTNKLQDKLANLKAEYNLLESKLEALRNEKLEQEKKYITIKQQKSKTKRASLKIRNERERLNKIKKSLDERKEIKNNLEEFLRALHTIEEIIQGKQVEVEDDIKAQILKAKNKWDEAQTKFNANNVIPFLTNAQESYSLIVEVFIKLCNNLPDSLLEEEFKSQVLTIVQKGFRLNTRHLSAVQSMMSKLEKGIEIAPLASFANEIRKYYSENLEYFRIVGWVDLNISE
ncbi:MAG: hypothetical protein ACTSWJ_04625 [Candidatus Heimdallarchaeaceae archaeon]